MSHRFGSLPVGSSTTEGAAGSEARVRIPRGNETRSGRRPSQSLRVTMAAGFQDVVARAIRADIPGVALSAISSGSIDLRCSPAAVKAVASLPYLSLVLLELARVEER